MIDALIFDFDGVIIDTETSDFRTWQETFRYYDAELDRSLWVDAIGASREAFDVYQHLEDSTGVKRDREAVRLQRRRRYLDLVEASPILPGVTEYILEARRLGLRLGVASSSSRAWVEGHLMRRGLLKHFDCIKAAEDVSRVKPDPELYAASVAHFGIRPPDAVAIEDSANGVSAAKQAGLFCVAVPNRMTRELPLDRADIRLEALTDMPLGALVERANGRHGGS